MSMDQLRSLSDQIFAAERDARLATDRRSRKAACKRVASLRKIARDAAAAHRRTRGR